VLILQNLGRFFANIALFLLSLNTAYTLGTIVVGGFDASGNISNGCLGGLKIGLNG
jgi:hypothetical protein